MHELRVYMTKYEKCLAFSRETGLLRPVRYHTGRLRMAAQLGVVSVTSYISASRLFGARLVPTPFHFVICFPGE
jgi:hypothetical protein